MKGRVGNAMTVKLLKLLLITLFLFGCRPEEESTQYAVTKKPLSGPDQSYETNKNIAIRVEYVLDDQPETSNLNLVMVQGPSNGSLDNCEKINPLNFYYGNLSAQEYEALLTQSNQENQSMD